MNTSSIKGVQPNGTWQPNDGDLLFKYEYDMEDGTTITAFHKTNAPVAEVGEAVEYEVTKQSARGKSGKVRKPGSFTPQTNGNGFSRMTKEEWAEKDDKVSRQWAINSAMNWVTNVSPDPSKDGLRQVAATARLLIEMRDDLDGFISKYKNADTNDLPF